MKLNEKEYSGISKLKMQKLMRLMVPRLLNLSFINFYFQMIIVSSTVEMKRNFCREIIYIYMKQDKEKGQVHYTCLLSAPETICSSFINCTQSRDPL